MNYKLIFTAWSLFFSLIVMGQEVSLKQEYNLNQSYEYELIRGKEDSRYPSMKNVRTSTEVKMIFSKDNEDLINHLSYGATVTYDAEGKLIEKNLSSTSDLFNGFNFKIKLDIKGRLIEVVNFTEVQKEFEKYLFKMTKDPKSFKELVYKTYKDEQAFLINYFPEIIYHFDIYGHNASKNTTISKVHFNQNPLGGESIPMKLSLKLEKETSNEVILKGQETIKDEDIAKIIETTIIEISKKRGQEIKTESIPKLSMVNSIEYKYDVKKKIFNEVSVVKTSISQGMIAEKFNTLKLIK